MLNGNGTKHGLKLPAVLCCIFMISQAFAQDTERLVEAAERMKAHYNKLPDTLLSPDRRITMEATYRAKQKQEKQLDKALALTRKKPLDAKQQRALMLTISNASLWHTYVEGDEFLRLMKRMLTGTQISQKHIHRLRDAYHKWIINPTNHHFSRYNELLLLTGRSYEILCELQVPERSQPVFYQAVSEEQVKRLQQLSKHVPIGNYYMWESQKVEAITRVKVCVTKKQPVDLTSM